MKTKRYSCLSTACAALLALAAVVVTATAAPEIAVIQAKRVLKDGNHSIAFGEINRGNESAAATVVIRNTGTSALRELKVVVKGTNPKDFVITQPLKTKLLPGGKTTFTVRFVPLRTGYRQAQVRILSNDADENPFRIKVQGKGLAPQPLDWSGQWETNWGSMVLTQTGTSVVGTYTHDSGNITASVKGETLVGTWSESPSYAPPNDAGDFVFTISADRKSFTGSWRYGSEGEMSGGWDGTKVE